jgi:hypothetical protein
MALTEGAPLRTGDAADPGPHAPRRGEIGAEASRQEVRRRHVLYVPGYDPRDPQLYRRLAALELRRFGKLWGARVEVAPEAIGDPATPSVGWKGTVAAGEARVEVAYETLRWDDIVAQDFATPLPVKILRGFKTLFDSLASGQLFRVARASPWCAIVWIYPVCAFLGAGLLGAAFGAFVAFFAGLVGAPGSAALVIGALVAFAGALGVMAAFRRAGSYVIHLIDDGRSQRHYIRRRCPELERRVDAFAARIREVKARSDVDEVLVVGHSSGSFIAIDAVARAYEVDPELGRGRPALALLTVGATELLVALHPAAGWFRERLKRIAMEPTLFWAEVYGPWDLINFPNRDPVEELGLDVPSDRPNPTFRRAFLTKMLKQGTIDELKRRLNLFRLHFQFIMSNEVQGPFDYFSLVCGPWRARTQFRRTARGALMSPHLGPPVHPAKKAE